VTTERTIPAPTLLGSGSSGSRPRIRVREALAELRSVQKPGGGFPAYTRWVNRRLARYPAALLASWGLGPNAVTAASAIASAAAVALVVAAPADAGTAVAAAVLLALGYVLDSADGQVARLTGRGSVAGEWLDHVVDAIRTPAIHLAVLAGLARQGAPVWLQAVAMLYCVVAVGQFMSQILAEQLSGRQHRAPAGRGGVKQSFLTLPTDTGVLCWSFVLWGAPALFAVVYTALFAANALHAAVSMRRKHEHLVALGRAS
jgi:phosphatidylglycerophosphate synthase